METVLLVDDERLFKAVEGTCLRREKCRLVMAPVENLLQTAAEKNPDLILVAYSSDITEELLRVLKSRVLGGVPVIILELPLEPVSREVRESLEKRKSGSACVLVPVLRAGTPEMAAFDAQLDEQIQAAMSWGRRGGDRVSISLPVRCTGEGIKGTLRTKNISPSGLFLKTNRPVDPGTEFDVHFTLPSSVFSGEDRAVPVIARCEVVRQVGSAGPLDQDLIPGLGVRFVDLGDEGRLALKRVAGKPRSTRGHEARAAG